MDDNRNLSGIDCIKSIRFADGETMSREELQFFYDLQHNSTTRRPTMGIAPAQSFGRVFRSSSLNIIGNDVIIGSMGTSSDVPLATIVSSVTAHDRDSTAQEYTEDQSYSLSSVEETIVDSNHEDSTDRGIQRLLSLLDKKHLRAICKIKKITPGSVSQMRESLMNIKIMDLPDSLIRDIGKHLKIPMSLGNIKDIRKYLLEKY